MSLHPQLFIDGRWLDDAGAGHRPLIDPATEAPVGLVPLADAAHVDAAAASAARGFEIWRRRTALDRCRVLVHAAALMRERAQAIAADLSTEQGKPLAEAVREVTLSADIVEFQAEEAKRLYGRTVPARVEGVLSHAVLHEPVGPVAAFTAWNFPVNLPARKLGAALAAGCSVVLKPAEETPTSAMHLVRCLLDAGLPPQAVQLVCGDPAMVSSRLIAHPAIAKVSLTGSVAVGRLLAEQCARHSKRFAGELGGHAPVVVCEDANVESVLKLAVPAKLRNAGQVCASPIRFVVARSLYARFVEGFADAARALRLGPGSDPATQMGPLAHARRLDDMRGFVDDALHHGAHVVCGGQRAARAGWFFEPTLITDAPDTSRVMQVEPFGPIAVVHPFDTLDEAITRTRLPGNATRYALAAYAFTRDLAVAHRLSNELDAGMVGINHFGVSQPEMPFGGRGASGDGVEMGAEGILAYTHLKTVTVGSP
jgi:succinate-semialdehyde dehydrogenase/glutarate-semialdehyde dehydrogenase